MKIININTEVCVADIENREGKNFFRLLIQFWVTRKIFAEHEPRSIGENMLNVQSGFWKITS